MIQFYHSKISLPGSIWTAHTTRGLCCGDSHRIGFLRMNEVFRDREWIPERKDLGDVDCTSSTGRIKQELASCTLIIQKIKNKRDGYKNVTILCKWWMTELLKNSTTTKFMYMTSELQTSSIQSFLEQSTEEFNRKM